MWSNIGVQPGGEQSFTLIELLIVIGIVAILSVGVVLTLNPAELLKQARDSRRLADTAILDRAINTLLVETSDIGTPNTVYVSIPDPTLPPGGTSNCPDANMPEDLPSLPSGWVYQCVASSDLTKVDGTGWVPANFQSFSAGAPLSVLPVDPINTVASGYYYTYVSGGSYVTTAALESQKFIAQTAREDGGTDPTRVEQGSNLKLWRDASGLIGWWPFDEGSALTAADASGKGNNGTLVNGPLWVGGKVGSALSFDNLDDYVSIPDSDSLFATNTISIMAWVKRKTDGGGDAIYGDDDGALPHPEYSLLFLDVGGKKIRFQTNHLGSNPRTAETLAGTPVAGVWAHVAFTWDGSNIKFYVDGANTATSPAGATVWQGAVDYRIGRKPDNTAPFDGLIDEVRVYRRRLSGIEIQQIYNATK